MAFLMSKEAAMVIIVAPVPIFFGITHFIGIHLFILYYAIDCAVD
jgi:uncharacterized membrane protein